MRSNFASIASSLLLLAALSSAAPIPRLSRRLVPQEHSDDPDVLVTDDMLKLNNPDGFTDAIFGLLGNAAASTALGTSNTTPECLQQRIADQAFTNAKEAGDIDGMTSVLIYRALERNTNQVGLKSDLCAETAVNPEIDALEQHQDSASEGAAAANKAITLELARQIASIGGDHQLANRASTFAPGDVNDPTAKGLSCNTIAARGQEGCKIAENLIVLDATPEELDAAVADIAGAGEGEAVDNAEPAQLGAEDEQEVAAGNAAQGQCPPQATVTVTAVAGGAQPTATAAPVAGQVGQGQEEEVVEEEGAAQEENGAGPGDIGDFGSCSVPEITFGVGIDGRTETSCEPADKASFRQNSAQNCQIVVNAICNELVNTCGADETALATCETAKTAVQGIDTKTGEFVDAFNNVFGITTNFAAEPQIDNQGNVVAPAAGAGNAAAGAGNAAAGANQAGANSQNGNGQQQGNNNNNEEEVETGEGAQAGGNAPAGGNLQTFDEALGGISAPEVRAGGRGFEVVLANGQVNGDFLNLSAALTRSCDVHKNLCANAANSGADFSVAECDAQQQRCVAARA